MEDSKISTTKNKVITASIIILALLIGIMTGFAAGIRYQNSIGTAAVNTVSLFEVVESGIEEDDIYSTKQNSEFGTMQSSRKYAENLELAIDSMLSGAADAETCGNLTIQVWYNAIHQIEDEVTDKYTRPDGNFVGDFDDALYNLSADSDYSLRIDSIKENKETVNSIVKRLKNPPEEYQLAYESVYECYDAYITFVNMIINVTGSYQSFSEDFDNADSEFMHCYDVMQFYL